MGNNNESQIPSLPPGICEFLTQEFQRITNSSTRNYLTLSELLQARHPEDYPFSFNHIGIVYMCDHDFDGVFNRQDLEMFVLWVQVNMASIQMYQFQAQLQAKTVACMLDILETKQGQNKVVTWFINMLLESHPQRTIDNNLYITIDSIKTIYELFNIQIMTDMDIQQFFYLVKKSSEEMGFKIEEIIENDEEEQYIIIRVCEEFIRSFFKGVGKLLSGIGYKTDVL